MPIIMQCNPDAPGAYASRSYPDVFVRESHHGLVVSLFERNGYDDSDFCAVVWNPETQSCETVTYATTRGWTYCNGATIDASPEIISAARQWQEGRINERRAEISLHTAGIPVKGSRVTVRVTRGKNKHLDGQSGAVFWIGNGYGYNSPPRAGVEINGEKVFLDSRNLYALDPAGNPAPQSWADSLGKLAAAKYWHNHTPDYSI